ncbi:TPA: hypothetical protein N0F65_011860 [Lagenidium giganteum]|uniref:Uncharacterized protein n=1 Tax=Lagenidium giganteum TaxID=4803 RepID=A0AAV2YHN5_9STRA|nr:TPA: hypothetical protein N0F65_011860 [Lagenidium giganteum]
MSNGGGSNILRGGKRTYDCKTLIGNFVEEAYRPNAITASWPGNDNYETSTRHQMLNGVNMRTREFGTGLKKSDDPRFDYNQLVNADRTRGSNTCVSIGHSAHNNSSKATEFAAPREMKGRRMPPDELDKHRARWSNENEQLKQLRYVTESSATQDYFIKESFRKELFRTTSPSASALS